MSALLKALAEVRELPRNVGPVQAGALAPWKIVELAVIKGEFEVSWRYRDGRLARRCNGLRRKGWLRQIRAAPGSFVYRPGRLVVALAEKIAVVEPRDGIAQDHQGDGERPQD